MKKFFLIMVLLVSVTATFTSVRAASPIYVDGTLGNDSWPGDTLTSPVKTIQNGIGKVDAAGTVTVAAGTYDEQVVINNSLTLQGAGDTTIVKPSSSAILSQVFGGLFYGGGTKQIAGIVVANVAAGTSVTLANLKVDSSSVTTKPTGADYLAGIFYRETGGTVDTVSVVGGGAWSALDRGYGAYLSAGTNTVSVEIKNSSITNFDKNGIDSEGNHLTVDIHDNTITGRGPTLVGDEVQNGVVIGRDAVGTVNYNTISNLEYGPKASWAAGIIVYHYVTPTGKSATANNNTITNCQIGIMFKNANALAQDNIVSGGTVGLAGIHAQPNYAGAYTASFVGNTVSGITDYSAIDAETYATLTPGTGATLTVTIRNNTLTDGYGAADGIYVGGGAGSVTATISDNIISNWPEYGINLGDARVAGATITGNTITDNALEGVHIAATVNAANVSINFNKIFGNVNYGVNNGGTVTVDATQNWWGDASGPYHSPDNTCGLGNAVSDKVDFMPWWTTTTGGSGTLAVHNITKDTYYCKIQDAVDDAASSDTIEVAAGTYDEQVVIDKSLTIQGVGDTSIVKPSSAAKLTQVFSGLFWFGGTKQIAGIVVANVAAGTSVTLANLKVDSSSVTTKPTGADYLAGIFYRETGGTVDTVSVTGGGSWSGTDRGYGMYLSAGTNSVSVEVKGSTITNYDKNGIEVMGNKLTANIHNNTITGRGSISDEAQNGVSIGRDAVATVNFNGISNLAYYQPLSAIATGILFYHYVSPTGKSATANNNTITDCQAGIIFKNANAVAQDNIVSGGTVGRDGIFTQPNYAGAYTASFVNNTVSGITNNAAIDAETYATLTPGTGATLTATIRNNTLTGGYTTADGIYVGGGAGSVTATISDNIISGWPEYGINLGDARVAGATITGNTITNNALQGVSIAAAVNAANVSINFNKIFGNVNYGVNNGGTVTVDATQNWWGDASGPYHSPDNTCGLGNAVSDKVDFMPWWTTTTGGSGTLAVHNITKDTYYCKIQDAVDDAASSDTIEVAAGTYTENVNVNKSLTLQGASSATVTVNAADQNIYVFNVTASSVNISGFTVSGTLGYTAGIHIGAGVTLCNISDNNITGCGDGILLDIGSNNNTFTSNIANSNRWQGFELHHSDNNTFTSNTASLNTTYGFRMESSDNNTFTGNTANSNSKYGFSLVKGDGDGCDYNTFTNNTANSNTVYGFREDYGDHNTLTGNTFDANVEAGIRLKEVITNLTLDNNSFTNSLIGIDIATVVTNVTSWTVTHNNIAGNTTYGVSNAGTGLLNDLSNWWGDASGPFDNKTLPGTPNYNNPTGTGNAVTSYVDYSPFYLDEGMTTLSIYTLTYTAGAGGTITGATLQLVNHGGSGTPVEAIPDPGYHFVKWDDDYTGNPRTDTDVIFPISVTATFAINTYTLTYTAGANGTTSGTASQTVDYGTSGTAVTAIPDTGYHFVKWDDDYTSNPRTDTDVIADISVTSIFAANTYTVTFDTQSGTTPVPASKVVTYDSTYGALATTTRTGYTFAGWWTGTGGTGTQVLDTTTVTITADQTLYAKWTANTYTVTFDAQSGTTPAPLTKVVTYDSTYGALATTTRTGYTFAGWWTGAGGTGTQVLSTTPVTITAAQTLYAKWTANTHTLTYKVVAHGTISGTTPQTVNYGGSGTAVTAVPTTGYHFVNWSDGVLTATRTDANVTSNITVIAIFAINIYTLTVNATNGSVAKMPDLAEYDDGTTVSLTATPDTGYHFTGWSGNFPPGHETDNPLVVTMDSNKTLTANFAINVYTVIFQTDGTAGATLTGTTTQMVNHGADCTAVRANAPTNYRFDKWTKGGVNYSTDNPLTVTDVTENMTLKAIFASGKPSAAKNWHLYE